MSGVAEPMKNDIDLEGDDNLLGNFDAVRWAERFVQVRHNLLTGPERKDIAEDQETMHTWFAGAIMTGYDHGRAENRREDATLNEIREALLQHDRPSPRGVAEPRHNTPEAGSADA